MKMLAILKKDLRRLGPQLVLFWLLLGLAARLDPTYAGHPGGGHRNGFALLCLALLLACGALVVEVVQQEALAGDRQYWLTRPIDRRALWVAKAAFVLLGIDLAILACQCAVLVALGIPLGEHLGTLLIRHLPLVAFLVLPAAALGAVTRNPGQAFLGALLLLAGMVASQAGIKGIHLFAMRVGDIASVSCVLIVVGAGAGLLVQCTSRRTVVARAVMVTAAVLLCLFPQVVMPQFEPPPADLRPVVMVSLDAQPAGTSGAPAPRYALELPVRVEGLPAGFDITAEHGLARIIRPDSTSSDLVALVSLHDFSGGHGWLTIYNGQTEFALEIAGRSYGSTKQLSVRNGDYAPYLNTAVGLRLTMDLALSTRGVSLPRPGAAGEVVPGIGRCHEEEGEFGSELVCYSPHPRTALVLELPGGSRRFVVKGGLPVPDFRFVLEPVDRYSLGTSDLPGMGDLSGAHLVTGNVVSSRQAVMDVPSIRLSDYVPRR